MPQGISTDPADLENTVRRLGEVIDERYFQVSFLPGAGIGTGTVDLSTIAGNLYSGVSFPNGSSTFYTWTFGPGKDWRKLRLKSLHLVYSADVGSTNTFNLQLSGYCNAAGTLMTAARAVFGANVTAAGPASANGVVTYDFTTAGSDFFQSSDELCAFRIVRDGAGDANNNVFYFLRGLLTLAPG